MSAGLFQYGTKPHGFFDEAFVTQLHLQLNDYDQSLHIIHEEDGVIVLAWPEDHGLGDENELGEQNKAYVRRAGVKVTTIRARIWNDFEAQPIDLFKLTPLALPNLTPTFLSAISIEGLASLLYAGF